MDTGVAGSEDAIGDALGAAGLGWGDVGHVILTHKHQDHAGSAAAVLERSPDAMAYAGARGHPGDHRAAGAHPGRATATRCSACASWPPPAIRPGTSPCFDEAAGVLVAGDALRITDGAPTPPGGQFTEDADAAMASIAKLGALRFETLLVGHGEPIESGAAAMVRALAGG